MNLITTIQARASSSLAWNRYVNHLRSSREVELFSSPYGAIHRATAIRLYALWEANRTVIESTIHITQFLYRAGMKVIKLNRAAFQELGNAIKEVAALIYNLVMFSLSLFNPGIASGLNRELLPHNLLDSRSAVAAARAKFKGSQKERRVATIHAHANYYLETVQNRIQALKSYFADLRSNSLNSRAIKMYLENDDITRIDRSFGNLRQKIPNSTGYSDSELKAQLKNSQLISKIYLEDIEIIIRDVTSDIKELTTLETANHRKKARLLSNVRNVRDLMILPLAFVLLSMGKIAPTALQLVLLLLARKASQICLRRVLNFPSTFTMRRVILCRRLEVLKEASYAITDIHTAIDAITD